MVSFSAMKRTSLLAQVLSAALLALAWWTPARGAAKDVDAVFKAFWDARTPQDAAKKVPDIVGSGVSFDEALKRLKAGRPYAAYVPKGVIRKSYRVNGLEFFYALNIPDVRSGAQVSGAHPAARRRQPRDERRPRRRNDRRAGGRRTDLHHSVRMERRAVVGRRSDREPPHDSRHRQAHLQRRREPRRRGRRLRRRHGRVLHRDARHDAVTRASCR